MVSAWVRATQFKHGQKFWTAPTLRRGALHSLLIMVCALALAGCGAGPDAAPSTQQAFGAAKLPTIGHALSAHYPIGGYGKGAHFEVTTLGPRRIRIEARVPNSDPPTLLYWVYDGTQILQYGSDAKVPFSFYPAPRDYPEAYNYVRLWVLPPGSTLLAQACPNAREAGSTTIAGRHAIHFRCRGRKSDNGIHKGEIWLDDASGLLLRGRGLTADKVTEEAPIDAATFSTDPPDDARVTTFPPK